LEIGNKWSSKKGAGEFAFVTFVKDDKFIENWDRVRIEQTWKSSEMHKMSYSSLLRIGV